jgi:hypothetical protein
MIAIEKNKITWKGLAYHPLPLGLRGLGETFGTNYPGSL